jgi:hypothetical protein
MSWPSISIVPAGRLLEAGKHAQQGRLARAGAAQKAEQFALVDIERHVRNGKDVAKFLGDVLDAHEGLCLRIAPRTGVGGDLGFLGHLGLYERLKGRLLPPLEVSSY